MSTPAADQSHAITSKIWEEFSARLKGFIFKRIQNEYDVEDILQEIFFKIYINILNLKEKDKLNAWVYQIARNSITDYYRQKGKVVIDYMEAIEDEIDLSIAADNSGVALSCLKPMINDLPEIYKQAIVLTEFQGLTQQEMAKRLGLSLPGAKSRVQRAREKLKGMLLNCCRFEIDRYGNILDYQPKK